MNVVKLQALHCQCQQVWLEDNHPTEGCIVIVNAACLTFVLLYDVSRMQFLEQNAKALYYTQSVPGSLSRGAEQLHVKK